MIIIPAIDIIDGKPVRLYKGDYTKKEIVGEDVLKIALDFEANGAKYIHIVDLDGAKCGKVINKDIILSLKKSLKTPIEVGGGVRSIKDLEELIDCGVDRVIIGTKAIEDLEFLKKAIKKYKEKIAVAIDFKDGYVCTLGWFNKSEVKYIDFAKDLENIGVQNIIVTDISKDGTLDGVNLDVLKNLKEEVNIDITASGGVRDIEDIKNLKELNLYGVITGKALYKNKLSLKDSIKLLEG
ncbi:1-(5-phosphoribosyl)-5-[(5-phosphoribosylamino)methylideneamino]imidazole-4-carboxamide isomerase [Clostridium chrysemydis]|uniref:1-(5-phosphoribosyl)-5-[(5- phosphoribosylamino)methylideneamino]imidazole-4- carboxamide isomerase n=1 Tax=Clostridium chrysemydis TaxID=2665504 RepID=UPI0018845A7A|nr:1-(5-phosphoribosyl)-5-[(5-phosphoribosylamino)methylideneamino]imidazole-4-carboxamide isomerase [Clostridium chrysemydis]